VILDHTDMDYELTIGAIDDVDITFVNGQCGFYLGRS
jgi:hypothetical protein